MPIMKHSSWNILNLLQLVVLLWLAGCAATAPAPVRDLSSGRTASAVVLPATPTISGNAVHTVRRGDTLYSIAFRNGFDYRDLAAHNGIRAPYTIHVGQQVRLDLPQPGAVAQVVAAQAGSIDVQTSALVDSADAPRAPSAFEPVTEAPAGGVVAGPVASAAADDSTPLPPGVPATPAHDELPPTDVVPAPTAPPPTASRQAVTTTVANIRWQWPADGTVLKSFVAGDQSRRGVDISGKTGDPVHAAADGVVVYSGNGLIGYGELVIIKHDDTYLSAYGHNRTRLVAEGARVTGGQLIAEMGSTASRQMLHFEIRKNGKPVNPMDFLPRR